jgi:hypothetical protein
VVPRGALRTCHPCYPGGSGRAGQLYGPVRHRPSPNVHGVGTLSFVTRLHLGSLHATACAVARVLRGHACQGTQRFRLPVTPPSSYLGGLPSPRAGLPPASPTVSTAYGRSILCLLAGCAAARRATKSREAVSSRKIAVRSIPSPSYGGGCRPMARSRSADTHRDVAWQSLAPGDIRCCVPYYGGVVASPCPCPICGTALKVTVGKLVE